MERFVAPQFIDVEDKIIGPITTRQFILMIIGGIVIFLAYKIFDMMAFILISVIVFGLVVLFGFVKINGRRFSKYMGSMIEALRRPRLRVWHKQADSRLERLENQSNERDLIKTDFTPRQARVSSKNLKELALLVDTGGRYQPQG